MRIRRTILAGCTAMALAAVTTACGSAVADEAAGSDPGGAAHRVQRQLDAFVADGDVIGAGVTLREGHRLRQLRAGVGDLDTGARYPRGGHTRIASVTKAFTSAMVLQLVSEGRVTLDESVEEYLPGLLRGDGIDAHAITVRHLLRHQSGLPEIGDPDNPPDPTRSFTPQELIDLALANPARGEPGGELIYTNTNYVVAGMLIEEVTGRDYRTALRERITEPLRLKQTYLPEAGDTGLPKPHPHGYATGEGEPVDVTAADASGPWASGGIVSTGADLDAFFTALTRGEVVDAEQLEQMRDTVPMTGVPGVDYGLGYLKLPDECRLTLWGQAGDVPGFQTMVATTADGSRSVSISVNQSPTEAFGPQQLLGLLNTALC